MQAAWDVMRDEAAANYGMEEGWQEEEARDKMGPLADRTPAGVRNRGAAERKKARRVEAVVAVGIRHAADTARGEGDIREEGATRQEARETAPSHENMDELLQAVAEAISHARRETREAEEDPHLEAYGAQEDTTARGT